MLTIQIHEEQPAQRLREIAERENRTVEDILRTMLAQYPAEAPAETAQPDRSEPVKRVRRKAYAQARQYWASVGDAAKAAMTDEELDAQFGVFDEEGIPRLKSELKSLEPPVGSLLRPSPVRCWRGLGMSPLSGLHTAPFGVEAVPPGDLRA